MFTSLLQMPKVHKDCPPHRCYWHYDKSEGGWKTECGIVFYSDSRRIEREMLFCYHCGSRITTKRRKEARAVVIRMAYLPPENDAISADESPECSQSARHAG